MKIKPGVSSGADIHPGILHAMNVADALWRFAFDRHLVVTSLGDGEHAKNSRHYGIVGDVRVRAVDFRTHNLKPEQRAFAKETLKRFLGEYFDVILEDTHLHIEIEPYNLHKYLEDTHL